MSSRLKISCRIAHVTAGLLLVFVFTSCNQPFDPRAPFNEQMVVYSVLSNDRSVQFVRVVTSYNPPDFDPSLVTSEKPVTGAFVFINDGFQTYTLADTLYPRPDTSRYNSPLHAYAVSPFRPVRGRFHYLTISSPSYGTATSSIRLPEAGFVSYSGISLLNATAQFPPEREIVLTTGFSSLASAFVLRMFVDFELDSASTTILGHVEVPLRFKDTPQVQLHTVQNLSGPLYPLLRRRASSGDRVVYLNAAYQWALLDVLRAHPGATGIRFVQVVFLLVQTEENFYRYYFTANNFQDSLSVRLDEPMYSNINGGVGMFGGYVVDSTIHVLPSTFTFNR